MARVLEQVIKTLEPNIGDQKILRSIAINGTANPLSLAELLECYAARTDTLKDNEFFVLLSKHFGLRFTQSADGIWVFIHEDQDDAQRPYASLTQSLVQRYLG